LVGSAEIDLSYWNRRGKM